MNAVLERLREATRVLHDTLESTPTLRAATERPGHPDAHGDYLEAMAVGVWPVVRALLDAPGGADLALLPDPAAWESLKVDLGALGRSLPRPDRTVPPPTRDDGAWGRLYVVRGAEAGVMVMARQLAKADAARTRPSTFASRLAARRAEWPVLCTALGGLSDVAARRAAEVAREDFQFVLSSITAWERERVQALSA